MKRAGKEFRHSFIISNSKLNSIFSNSPSVA